MSLREKALIEMIRATASASKRARGNRRTKLHTRVLTGIGDDCAVLRFHSGQEILVTTDFSLEGVHFRLDWHPPESIAHRCLARGLSDIAAMGGEPVAAFLSLALPKGLPPGWVNRFMRSLIGLGARFGVTLAGGDTAESPNGILADIVVIGTAPKGRAILRSGAQAGDRIFVSGALGASSATIWEMRRNPKRKLNPREYPEHFFPEPRIELGRILREKKLASAMIDVSDGLSTDLTHICEESAVGAEIVAELIPRASVGKPEREVDLRYAIHGGEDYELLFTAPKSRRVPPRIAGIPITQIGKITPGPKIFLMKDGQRRELQPRGWEHFRSK